MFLCGHESIGTYVKEMLTSRVTKWLGFSSEACIFCSLLLKGDMVNFICSYSASRRRLESALKDTVLECSESIQSSS